MARPYQIIDLAERTPEWWEWRRAGVGSADAAAILGVKRAKTVERVLAEKQDPAAIPKRLFTRHQSAALERVARSRYIETVGVAVAPVCCQSLARPWQRASLDGMSADGERAVEIKCGDATYQRVASQRRPPSPHYAQLQHILSVTGLPVIDYWCFVKAHAPLRLEVPRDDAFIARLIAAEEVFWRRLGTVSGDVTPTLR